MQADPTCKYLTERFPALVAAWARGTLNALPRTVQLESPELLAQPLRADFVLHLPDESTLLHLEFQTTFTPDLPWRMLRYYVRLRERFPERTVEQTVFVLKPGGAAVQAEYRDAQVV
ncbi:MAG: hypothetical protein NZ693_10810, partial [Thermoflexales bacterium]|nr:hypothetical protein [Thermoflexales bacterium]